MKELDEALDQFDGEAKLREVGFKEYPTNMYVQEFAPTIWYKKSEELGYLLSAIAAKYCPAAVLHVSKRAMDKTIKLCDSSGLYAITFDLKTWEMRIPNGKTIQRYKKFLEDCGVIVLVDFPNLNEFGEYIEAIETKKARDFIVIRRTTEIKSGEPKRRAKRPPQGP